MNFRFDLRHLRAFLAVAEALHFKRAAETLCITQPALSRLIKGLEESIEAKLFSRTTRQVELTEAGRLFLAECQQAFTHFERGIHLAQRATEGDIGHIAVAYNDFSINGVLPRILDLFKEKHPDISIELVYMPSHEQHNAIQNHDIDVGFLIGPLALEGIETHRSARERIVVILPKRHPLAERGSVRMEELADEKFILGTESGWREFRDYVFRMCMQAGFTPKILQEASTSSGIFGLVAANMGVSLYSECVEKFKREDIAIVPLAEREHTIETIAAWNTAYISPSFSLLRDLLQSELKI
ncbi:LysR family transcriptional regulator [Billgrantia endophytica]|nr:LysR family transcriptional regulator [Halomonas endophytica]